LVELKVENLKAIISHPDHYSNNEDLRQVINEKVGTGKDCISKEKYVFLLKSEITFHPALQLKEIPSMISVDESEVTFKFVDNSKVVKGDSSAWYQFINRIHPIDGQKALMAAIGAIYVKEHRGRRACVLQGAGMDGKSVFLRVIQKNIGHAATSVSRHTFGKGNKFVGSVFFGKRAVFYPDCKNQHVTRSEIVHSFTGGDTVPVEHKGKAAFDAEIYGKMFIATNESIKIGDKENETSRVIYLKVKPVSEEIRKNGDPEWEERLQESYYHFIYDCLEAYKELCPNHGNIFMSKELEDFRDSNCQDDVSDFLSGFIEDYLKIDPNCKELSATIKDEICNVVGIGTNGLGRNPNQLHGDLKRLLQDKYGCKLDRIKNRHYIVGVKLIRGGKSE
jgi:hypothetical protein